MSIFYNTRQNRLFDDFNPTSGSIQITKNLYGIDIKTPFNKSFVDELKVRIPFSHRVWDGDLKVWRVTFAYANLACEIVEEIYGFCPEIDTDGTIAKFEKQTYLIEYVGRSKQRDGSESLSLGFCQNAWNVILPEKVLREFFDGKTEDEPAQSESAPVEPKRLTYYQLLGLKQAVEQSAVKKAYYRMAKQWHPDVCKEPTARERFEAINNAYKILGEPKMRKRYDAGLAFERAAKQQIKRQDKAKSNDSITAGNFGYVPPLRCGIVTVDGEYGIGKIIVSKIHTWEDWIENGKTAVASWNNATMSIETIWV